MLKKIGRFLWKALLWFLFISVLLVLLFRFVPVPVTYLMLQRCVQQKIDGKSMRLKKDWISLNKIPNNMQLAVVCAEDQNFLWHHGIDFGAIDKAVKYNEKQKKRKHPRTHGASTISQQTAKNVFLFPQRNLVRKGLEVYFTLLIELFWSKERIMEVYLNVIETGDGIYGVEAASQFYFHHSAKSLSASEAALLTSILPNPRKYSASKPSAYISNRRGAILHQMNLWGGKLDYKMKEFDDDDKK